MTNNQTKIFNALGDDNRYKIYSMLLNGSQACVSELAGSLGISVAGACQQLKVLEEVNLIKPTRNGQKVCYEVNYDNNLAQSLNHIIKEENER